MSNQTALTIEDIAWLAEVSTEQVWKWIRTGKLLGSVRKRDGKTIVFESDYYEFVRAQAQEESTK